MSTRKRKTKSASTDAKKTKLSQSKLDLSGKIVEDKVPENEPISSGCYSLYLKYNSLTVGVELEEYRVAEKKQK